MSEDKTPRMPQDDRIGRLFELTQSLVGDMQIVKADLQNVKNELEERRKDTKPMIEQIYAAVAATREDLRETNQRLGRVEQRLDGVEQRLDRVEEITQEGFKNLNYATLSNLSAIGDLALRIRQLEDRVEKLETGKT